MRRLYFPETLPTIWEIEPSHEVCGWEVWRSGEEPIAVCTSREAALAALRLFQGADGPNVDFCVKQSQKSKEEQHAV